MTTVDLAGVRPRNFIEFVVGALIEMVEVIIRPQSAIVTNGVPLFFGGYLFILPRYRFFICFRRFETPGNSMVLLILYIAGMCSRMRWRARAASGISTPGSRRNTSGSSSENDGHRFPASR